MVKISTINRRGSTFLVFKKFLSSFGIPLSSAWQLMFDLSWCPRCGFGPFSIVIKGTGEKATGEMEFETNLLICQRLDESQALC